MARKKDVTPQHAEASEIPEDAEVFVDHETVDPAAAVTSGDETVTLTVKSSGDELYRRRVEDRGDAPEPAAMLTDDRLIETAGRYREVPEGFWQRFVYEISFHLINLGDSRAVRERKEMDRKISFPFEQGTKFVPVLTRKGRAPATSRRRSAKLRWYRVRSFSGECVSRAREIHAQSVPRLRTLR